LFFEDEEGEKKQKRRLSLCPLRGVLCGWTVRAGVASQLAHALGEARDACCLFVFVFFC
jgi:hypothetical protein